MIKNETEKKYIEDMVNILEKDGWTQNQLWNQDGCLCLMGASMKIGENYSKETRFNVEKLLNVKAIEHDFFGGFIHFNDHYCTTKEKVIRFLNEAKKDL